MHRTTALSPNGYGATDTHRFVVASCELAPGVPAGAAVEPRAVAFPGLVVRVGTICCCVLCVCCTPILYVGRSTKPNRPTDRPTNPTQKTQMRHTLQLRPCNAGPVVQCPSFNVQILRVSYHLTLTASNGCGFSPTVTVPVTFVPSTQQPLPLPMPAPVRTVIGVVCG